MVVLLLPHAVADGDAVVGLDCIAGRLELHLVGNESLRHIFHNSFEDYSVVEDGHRGAHQVGQFRLEQFAPAGSVVVGEPGVCEPFAIHLVVHDASAALNPEQTVLGLHHVFDTRSESSQLDHVGPCDSISRLPDVVAHVVSGACRNKHGSVVDSSCVRISAAESCHGGFKVPEGPIGRTLDVVGRAGRLHAANDPHLAVLDQTD